MKRTHTCPGRCEREVANHMFACPPCWSRLPRDLRQPINDNYLRDPRAHMLAMADAQRWYRENPAVAR